MNEQLAQIAHDMRAAVEAERHQVTSALLDIQVRLAKVEKRLEGIIETHHLWDGS